MATLIWPNFNKICYEYSLLLTVLGCTRILTNDWEQLSPLKFSLTMKLWFCLYYQNFVAIVTFMLWLLPYFLAEHLFWCKLSFYY